MFCNNLGYDVDGTPWLRGCLLLVVSSLWSNCWFGATKPFHDEMEIANRSQAVGPNGEMEWPLQKWIGTASVMPVRMAGRLGSSLG